MDSGAPIGQPTPTRDVQQGIADLREYGYAIHLDYLTPEQTKATHDRFKEQAEMEQELGFNFKRPHHYDPRYMQEVSFMLNKGRVFIDLMMNPYGLQYCEATLGKDRFKLFNQQGMYMRGGEVGTNAMHHDQMGLGYPTPRPLMLNCMLALANFDDEAGATRFVPGSHKWNKDPGVTPGHPDQAMPSIVHDIPPGSVVLWEGRTWHRAGDNRSADRTRLSITTTYCDLMMNAGTNYLAGLHDDVYETMTDDERLIAGFRLVYNTNLITGRYPGDKRKLVGYDEPYVGELHRS